MAAIFAFLLTLLIGPPLIRALRRLNLRHGQDRAGFSAIAAKSPQKALVPTMGGVILIASILISSLVWGDLSNRYLWTALLATAWLGLIGFADDLLKLKNQNAKGLLAMTKFSGQIFCGVALGIFLFYDAPTPTTVTVPFFKDLLLPLGSFYIIFVCLVIVGSSNAMNLTDGLDGLATGCMILVAFTFAIFSYITGHAVIADYLFLPHVLGMGELTVFCASLAGAGLGFLWFNAHPATIFMGDTGALSLGGAIGTVAILVQKEMLLLIVGGIFVLEVLSVILQVAGYKMTGRRLFLMAPIHHHFQLKGWHENKVVTRFWIIAIILSLVSIASLKLR